MALQAELGPSSTSHVTARMAPAPGAEREHAEMCAALIMSDEKSYTGASLRASTTSRTSTGETTSTSWFAALGRGTVHHPAQAPAVPPTSPRRSPPP